MAIEQRIEALEAVIPTLATKANIAELRTELKADIAELRIEVHEDLDLSINTIRTAIKEDGDLTRAAIREQKSNA